MTEDTAGIVAFFNTPVRVSNGENLSPAVIEVIREYTSRPPSQLPEPGHALVTFRELSDAGPLFSRFTANTSKIVESHFSGNLEGLIQRSQEIGGKSSPEPGYDASVWFKALPEIPILFRFNDADDMMPAQATFLFRTDAPQYLGLKGLMTVSTYLTGLLINSRG